MFEVKDPKYEYEVDDTKYEVWDPNYEVRDPKYEGGDLGYPGSPSTLNPDSSILNYECGGRCTIKIYR